jgi:hypothetical protein
MSTSVKPAAVFEAGAPPVPAPRFLPLETISVRLFSAPETDRRPVFGVISNISETGACIITNRALPLNLPIVIEIRSRRDNEPLKLAARTVWCALRLEPVKEIVGYLTGVCFDKEGADAVDRFLTSGIFQSIP